MRFVGNSNESRRKVKYETCFPTAHMKIKCNFQYNYIYLSVISFLFFKLDAAPTVISGLNNLRVLKTTQSAFVNFVDDEYRSLPDMHDRIFR